MIMDTIKREKFKKLFDKLNVDFLLIVRPESVRYVTEAGPTYGKINLVVVPQNVNECFSITSPRDSSIIKNSSWIRNVEIFDETPSESKNLENAISVASKAVKALGHGKLTLGVEMEGISARGFDLLKKKMPRTEYVDVSEDLRFIRLTKTPSEIQIIKHAAKIGDEIMLTMMENFQVGKTELDVAGEGVRLAFNYGVERFLWRAVMIGVRTALIGASPTHVKAKEGDNLLIDYGFVFNGYVCDITRTVALKKVPSKIVKMHETVTSALQAIIDWIEPGVRVREIVDYVQNAIEGFGYKRVPHDLGHGVGLEGHERPIFNEKEDMVLEAGMVFAVEPGIYIENLGGVRVEDEILVTPQGCEVLTQCRKNLIMN